ncbi:MAG TPA: twin-arginine translocation signal domain-containing protein [Gemmataceae bacterium]|nr:twin-arginine translocation signal domain-containing protein [Gemmataceae bacterium]
MSARMHRRRFLQTSAAVAAASTVASPAAALAPLDRVRVAIVGVAGQGGLEPERGGAYRPGRHRRLV